MNLLCILSIFFYPSVAYPASILDEIDFVLIQEMQLRKENGTYFLDITSVVRNSGKRALKLKKCKFDLSLLPQDSKEIRLGSTTKDEIFLESADTNVQLSANIGTDMETFHTNITSSEEVNSLLGAPKPKFNLRIQGDFDLGMKVKRGWVYQSGIKIDWVLKIEVIRDAFVKTYKAIEQAADKSGKRLDDTEEDDDFLNDLEGGE